MINCTARRTRSERSAPVPSRPSMSARSRSRVFSVAAILFIMGCSLRASGANRKPVLLLHSGRVHPKPFSSQSTPSPSCPGRPVQAYVSSFPKTPSGPARVPHRYARIWDAFGCCCRCLHLLLLDRVDPVDEMSQSGTIALGRDPTLLTHHGLDRWKGEHRVSFSHRDWPVGLLQSQPLGASSRHATRPATRVAADTLAESRLRGRPPVADLIVT